ncbi:LysR family transcriptional regulator, partial [Mesorhizobium sp. M4A.F.Ca.ET.029.04.2.1]
GIAISRNDERMRVVPIDYRDAHRAVGIITARGYVHHSFSEQLMNLIRTNLRELGSLT